MDSMVVAVVVVVYIGIVAATRVAKLVRRDIVVLLLPICALLVLRLPIAIITDILCRLLLMV